jgi:hypothetical protein
MRGFPRPNSRHWSRSAPTRPPSSRRGEDGRAGFVICQEALWEAIAVVTECRAARRRPRNTLGATRTTERGGMEPELVARVWAASGLSDLFAAFCISRPFYSHARFLEIMGLEKLLKGRLLYDRASEYRSLDREPAKQVLDRLARGWGHKVDVMIGEIAAGAPDAGLDRLADGRYDQYPGRALLNVMVQGYLESRYPVLRLSSEAFPTEIEGVHWDPLNSSAISKMVHALTRVLMAEFKRLGLSRSIWESFLSAYGEEEGDVRRFVNITFKGRVEDYLSPADHGA